MAIKFRCPHCRQLLGISTTKAGTTVDCPACGRSVNVPHEGGVATRPEQSMRPGAHPGLIDALHELTTFGTSEPPPGTLPAISQPVPRTRKPPVTKAASQQSDPSATAGRDVMRIIPLARAHSASDIGTVSEEAFSQLGALQPAEDCSALIRSDLLEPDIEDEEALLDEQPASSVGSDNAAQANSRSEPLPNELASALHELAATVPAKSPTAGSFQRQQPMESEAARRRSLFPIMLILPAFAAGLLIGTFWQSQATSVTPPQERKSDKSATGIVAPLAAGKRQLTGMVRWVDDSGTSSPDVGALILLLPTENSSRLRLDGRPLREAADSVARNAIEAALQELGGSVHQADDTGAWSANVPTQTPLTIIVVSRHRSRIDDQPVPPKILEALNQWFDTPLHVIGRLSVQQQALPAATVTPDSKSPGLDVEFKSAK